MRFLYNIIITIIIILSPIIIFYRLLKKKEDPKNIKRKPAKVDMKYMQDHIVMDIMFI